MMPMTRLVAALLTALALAGCSSMPPKAAAVRAAAHTCADLDLPGQTWGHILVDATRAAQLDDRWEGLYQALSDLAADPSTGVPRGCGRRGALDLSPSATYP